MSMIKKLKSLFIEEDPNAVPTPEQQVGSAVKTENTTQAETHYTSIPDPVISSVSDGKTGIDPKFIDILMRAIEATNKEGFDYLEFKNSLQSLSKLDMDEATRYKSSFIMGKTMGLTKEKLIDSVQHYITTINQEEARFKEALQKQKALQVGGKEEQLKASEADIAKKKQQIAQMQAEIEKQTLQLEKIRGEISEAIIKIDTTNAQFVAAHKLISNQMLEDVQKIKTYVES
ncbi:MAG: hypothetical protein IPN79_18155 [Saprospiraceae bacterium]|nr:hypothetical protein [Saprospiraceae bacterium]